MERYFHPLPLLLYGMDYFFQANRERYANVKEEEEEEAFPPFFSFGKPSGFVSLKNLIMDILEKKSFKIFHLFFLYRLFRG